MRFLTNIRLDELPLIDQAATQTGFAVTTRNTPLTRTEAVEQGDHNPPGYSPPSDCGSVWTSELHRDHGPFWAAFRRLKNGG